MSDPKIQPNWKPLLKAGLQEDGWPWDWTSGALASDKSVRARIVAKSSGVWAAAGLARAAQQLAVELAEEQGLKPLSIKSKFQDGDAYKKGDVLVEWAGPARLILALERPFLNLAAFASGVATQTALLVALVKRAKSSARVTLTRKTLPHYRDLSIHAVRTGGGYPHRISLSGGVLIKENHIASAGGIAEAVKLAREISPHLCKVEVEVRNPSELAEALDAQADVVMLDNFSPVQVRKAVAQVEASLHRPLIEVSGGVNADTIASYAIKGVDIISVGGVTHSVKAADFSLLMDSV